MFRRKFQSSLVLLLLLTSLPLAAAAPTPSPPLLPDATPEITPEVTPEVTPDLLTSAPVEVLQPEVLNVFPHDTSSYTEGLVLYDGYLYESAGENGKSDIQKADVTSGEVLKKVRLADEYFGEGLALVDDRWIQLTYHEHKAFIYDRDTFATLGSFDYQGDGWGLCYDGKQLWMSDGTDTLVTRDPDTFEITKLVRLTFQGYHFNEATDDQGMYLSAMYNMVNELECVGDTIYANVFLTDNILRIDMNSGAVTGVIKADNLLTADEKAALLSGEVLNGIAYDAEHDTFLLTGKHWPKLFEVKFNLIGETHAVPFGT